MRRAGAGALLGWTVLCLAGCTVAPADPGEPYRRWIEYGNRGDVEGQLRLLSDDATLSAWSFCLSPCRGRAAIRHQLEERTVLHDQSTPFDVQIAGDRITARRELRSDGTRRAGVERIVLRDEFRVRGGKIAAAAMPLDLRDPPTATYLEFLRAQSGWLDPAAVDPSGA
ncbi:MAG TPA: nuclear transport factor 2 family protein [Chloroflexota bacterium]